MSSQGKERRKRKDADTPSRSGGVQPSSKKKRCVRRTSARQSELQGVTTSQLDDDQELGISETTHLLDKIFNDSIHGTIQLQPMLVRIVDTPQFQRLRDIRQQACYRVYPGASHTRFEHSLGVAYLAGQLTRQLQERQPELGITEKDILCVQMAGLCHDLGHGPFSHVFDGRFLKKKRKKKWKHEEGSVMMLQYLLDDNKLRLVLTEEYKFTDDDFAFVEQMITGHQEDDPYKGRGENKAFLYEIVSNKRTGIDVDKWDYFARDCHHLGIKNTFDHARLIKFVRVIRVDGKLQLCYRDKEAGNLYDMFFTRHSIFRKACLHPVACAFELMLTKALALANAHIKYPGEGGAKRTLAKCVEDPKAFMQLSDRVYYEILWSTKSKLKEARNILMRIQTRQLYKLIGQVTFSVNTEQDLVFEAKHLRQYAKEIVKLSNDALACAADEQLDLQLNQEDVVFDAVELDFGMKNKDPIDRAHFYRKGEPSVAFKIPIVSVQMLLPDHFKEVYLRLYLCKVLEDQQQQRQVEEAVRKAFVDWRSEDGLKERILRKKRTQQ